MFRILCFVLLCPLMVSAVTLSLTEIAPRVSKDHPALKAARLSIEEARGRQLGAGRLSNPAFDASFQNESRVSPRTTVFGIDQSFPLTKRLSLEKQLTSQLVTAAEQEVRDFERRYIATARSLAVKLVALAKQRALRQQQTVLAKELSDFAKGRAKAGELSPLDAAQAQVDAQRLLLDARRIEIEVVSLVGELKPMLGLKPQEPLAISGQLPSLALPPSQAWQQRADYQLSQTKIEASETAEALAKAKRMPDVSAGIFASREQQDVTPRNTERTGFVGFRFTIPLPFWNRNQGEIAEKAATTQRAKLEAEALAAQITGEADTARREMQANAQLATETQEQLLPLVIEQASKLEKAYETGQTDLLTVLRAREQRLQLESAAVDAVRDFHLAKIRYESAIGHP